MTLLYLLLAVVLAAAILPWILEARRTPMTDALRADAPGTFAELPDGLTHYQWHGPRSDRVVVLVHGLSSPAWVFDGLVRGLMRMDYRVLRYDLYGRGWSDRPGGAQTIEFHTRQLAALLDDLGLRMPVTLLGFSMGGAIAAAYAAAEPDRVERLILLAPAGITYTPPPLLRVAGKTGPFGTWLWRLFGGLALRRAAAADARQATVIEDLPKRIAVELGRRGYLRSILSSERHALGESSEAAHREIGAMYIPTLAIWGEADRVIPVSALGQLALWNRQAHQEVIPGAAHSLAYTAPDAVLDRIRDFLREVPN